MAVDATAVARVVGIAGTYKDMRTGSAAILPQRIAVVAQGSSDAVYSTAKWTATSASEGGSRYGYGSPIHHILRQLMPINGDGVGTVPVEVLPLEDAGGGSAPAVGTIAVSGTQTAAKSYRVVVSNIKGREFAIAAAASDAAKQRAILDSITPVLEMPVTPTYTYGTVTGAAGGSNVGNGTIGTLSASGQPVPGVWVLKCTGAVANGGVFNLTDPDGEVVATGLTLTPGVGAATPLSSNGLAFTVTEGTTDFSVNDLFNITVPVTHITLTSKWHGLSANDLVISIEDGDGGTTFTLVQPTGGLINPDVTDALALIGNVWTTMVINGLNIDDTDALDEYQTFGDGRWGALVHKPLVVFTGNTYATLEDATAVSSTRTTDRVNCQLVSPGSDDLPFVVAARQVARIARVATNDPASDYGAQQCTGLTPGDDSEQWDYSTRNLAVEGGSSTIEVVDGVVTIGDIVTMYAPTGEEPPADRYVCDIVKQQNVIFNLALKFASVDWVGKPLIPDDQPTTNPNARKPKDAAAATASLLDVLALAAIISDPATAKRTIVCTIAGPKRLNVGFQYQLSGNSNIIDVDFNYGFFYGVQVAA